MSQGSTDELVFAYIAIREARADLVAKFEAQDGELRNDMAQIEHALLAICNEIKADSIRTEHGTVTRRLNERFYATDWDEFKKYVKKHDALDLFERRIHQQNFKHFMAEHTTELKGTLPPGVNTTREYGVSVRKSTTVKEVPNE